MIVIPMFVLSMLFFQNVRDSQIKERIKNVEVSFTEKYGDIQKKVEMCQMCTQVIMNYENFWNKVYEFSTKDDVDTHDLIYFFKNEISGLDKLVNSNPYLYQIRVYVDSERIQEMMPILYRFSRMKRLTWAKGGNFESGTWQFDFKDELFPSYVLRPDEHFVSLVTKISADEKGIDAVIEVATRMDLMFPDIYSSNEDEWTCFIDGNNNYYYNTDYESKWVNSISGLLKNAPKDLQTSYIKQKTINGEPVILCYKPLKELNGHLLKVVSLKKDFEYVNRTQYLFWFSFFIIIVFIILLLEKVVDIILKQFYLIMSTVRQVQKGDLNVRIPECGEDEIAELGDQINKMLDHITNLMDVNIQRELLFKDSEIRALQNQINAHFIYNVLESIKMMAEIDEKYDISDAVTSLGKLLRYSMKWTAKNVTVREELEYIKNYLALINLRFDYEIYLSLNIPDQIYDQKIPKMSLQPIIENAIYHGIEGIAEDTNIYVKGIMSEGYCTIELTDSGRGMTEEEVIQLQKKIEGKIEAMGSSGNGIGLKNVQDRIKFTFGEEYGIQIASKKDCYTKVIVKIPLITMA